MPINHTPIDESELDEKPKNNKALNILFQEIKPKYDFSDIVLPENVQKVNDP